MVISGLLITSSALVSYLGIEQIQSRRKAMPLITVLTSERLPALPVGRNKESHKKSLLQKLTPDGLIPLSGKVQREVLYPTDSPWKEHTVPVVVIDGEQGVIQAIEPKGKFGLDDARLVARYIRRYWSPYAVIGVTTGVALIGFSTYRLLLAHTLQVVVDRALTVGGNAVIKRSILTLALALPATIGIRLLGERLGARLSSRIANDIRYDLFAHLQDLPPDFHKEARLGDLLARFSNDMEKIEMALGKEFAAGIGDVIMLCVNLGVMVSLNLPLALISIVPMVLMRQPVTNAAAHFSETGYAMHQQKGLMTNAVQEGLRSLPLTKSFGINPSIRGYFGDELKKLEDKNTEALFGRALFGQTAISSYLLVQLTTLGAGTLFVLGGSLSMGGLLAAMMVTENFFFSYSQLANLRITQGIDASIGLRRLDELFQKQFTIVDDPDAQTLPSFHQAIHFDNVSFSYHSYDHERHGEQNSEQPNGNSTTQQQQVSAVNLTIEAGQFVAFVGPSGAGKSTIFNLLMRFYDVSDGRITIDGHDLRAVTLSSLRAQMGVVLQETFLFNTTILDNIRIVKPAASEADVMAAAQAAELHEFVLSLPDGYQTIVGEAGGRLSGGQRQRIAIARALLVNPAILLLDEATSSLDADTAAAVNATLQRVSQDRTVIMISHHLLSVVNADKIFVLKQGKLLEQGTHKTLLAESKTYRQLWQTQSVHEVTALTEDISNELSSWQTNGVVVHAHL